VRATGLQRFAGVDEAGYGPNLGPLVMTIVVAEGPAGHPLDLWSDLSATVGRAGASNRSIWIDDSKLVYKGGVGRARLETACLAAVTATGRTAPTTFGGLLKALGAGSLDDAELSPWIDEDPAWNVLPCQGDPFAGPPWRLVEIRTAVVGPARFNQELRASASKAGVHFKTFQTLLESAWAATTDEVSTSVVGDKHGGRHFYLDLLSGAFPDTWIDRGAEGPSLSRYVIRRGGRRLELALKPKADSENGLVALASMVSKTARELWMDAFNTYWLKQIPDLKPTAGYPVDAARFRASIEPHCRAMGLDPSVWWRAR